MTPEQLRSALRDADAERRRAAVASLGDRAPDDAAELLVEALGDDDWRVRKEAVGTATRLAERLGLVRRLVEVVCETDDVGQRNAALEVLGRLGSLAASALLEALDEAPSQARKFLVDALGDAGDAGAVQALVRATDDGDPNVAAAALDGLARVGGPEAEAALRGRLRAQDPFHRMAALDGLSRLDAAMSWEELEPLLSDRLARRVALRLLGRTGRAEAVGPLVEALGEKPARVASDSVRALARLHCDGGEAAAAVEEHARHLMQAALESVRELARTGEADARTAAAHLLVLARDPQALEAIVARASADELGPETLVALRAWGAEAVAPLLEVYRGASGTQRAVALELAAELAAEPLVRGESVDPALRKELRLTLLQALHDPDPDVVLGATRSMAWWAEASDAGPILELASGAPEEVARACGEVVEALLGAAPHAIRKALDALDPDGPAAAAMAPVLARMGGEHALERIQAMLSADDPRARQAAVEALEAVGGERAAELVGYALTDEHVDVQTVAARVLGRMRDESGRPIGSDALICALQSDSPAVQAAAARALGDAGEGRSVEPLRELVHSSRPGVAVAALQALRALHDPTLGDLLVECLGHADEEVVKQALGAIAEVGGPRTVQRLGLGLEHHAWDVRVLAVRLLGSIGGEETRRVLGARRARESDDLVRTAIDEALGPVGGAG